MAFGIISLYCCTFPPNIVVHIAVTLWMYLESELIFIRISHCFTENPCFLGRQLYTVGDKIYDCKNRFFAFMKTTQEKIFCYLRVIKIIFDNFYTKWFNYFRYPQTCCERPDTRNPSKTSCPRERPVRTPTILDRYAIGKFFLVK